MTMLPNVQILPIAVPEKLNEELSCTIEFDIVPRMWPWLQTDGRVYEKDIAAMLWAVEQLVGADPHNYEERRKLTAIRHIHDNFQQIRMDIDQERSYPYAGISKADLVVYANRLKKRAS